MRNAVKIITMITLMATIAASAVSLVALADGGERTAPRFTDTVGILTQAQADELTALLDEISVRQNFDVVVAVTNSMDRNNPRRYAADFYEQYGFGFGQNLDGIVLMVALQPERMFAVVTTGYGEYAFTNAGMIFLEDLFFPHLRNDRFFEAFTAYANAVDDFVTRARAGDRFDTRNIPLTPEQRTNTRIGAAVVSVVVAALIAGVVVAHWTRQLRSVIRRDFACDYVRKGSFALTLQRDIFLYRNIIRTPRQQNNGGGGGRGGSLRSSSGGSFSGRSGRF